MNKFFSLTVLIALATTTASAEPAKKIKNPFPSSVFGFKFGATVAEMKKACEGGGKTFTSQEGYNICSAPLVGNGPTGMVVGTTCDDKKICRYGLLIKNPSAETMENVITDVVKRFGPVHRFDGNFDTAWNDCANGDKKASAGGHWFFKNQNEPPALSFVYKCFGLGEQPSIAVWFTQKESKEETVAEQPEREKISEATYTAIYDAFFETCVDALSEKGGSQARKNKYCACGAQYSKNNATLYVTTYGLKYVDEVLQAAGEGKFAATATQANICAAKIEGLN